MSAVGGRILESILAFGAEDIHLWFTDYEAIGADLLDKYRCVLSEAERAQEQRYHFDRDRRRFVVTRALLRLTLSRYHSCLPQNWRFTSNAYSRPALCESVRAGAATKLRFNLSHTHSVILLGVTTSRDIGVDVEATTRKEVSIDIAERYFAKEEVAALKATAATHQHARFFEYWTLKESYIKARGMGLSIPLDRFSFSIGDTHSISLRVRPELGDDASRWRFWQFSLGNEYVAAVCAENTLQNGRCKYLAFEVIPLYSEKTLELTERRSSHSQPLRSSG